MTKPPRSSDEIREAYISFFREKGHHLLPPWPLVPIGAVVTFAVAFRGLWRAYHRLQ